MLRNSITLEELKVILFDTNIYKQAKNMLSFKNKCCEFTDNLFNEIKDTTQCIRLSVNRGEHWFLLANTCDHGIIIIDPTYYQILPMASESYPFFIGSREELWELAKEDDNSIKWFDYNWPVLATVIYSCDIHNDEMKFIFKTDGYSPVKIGNEIQEMNMDNNEKPVYSATFFNQSNSVPINKLDSENLYEIPLVAKMKK